MSDSISENSKDKANEELSVKEISDQATNKEADEIKREVLRSGESGEKADEKDVIGSPDSEDTMQGREEVKHQTTEKTTTPSEN